MILLRGEQYIHVAEFGVDESGRQIAAQMKKGIYPVGFPPIDSAFPTLRNVYLPQMMKDRWTLLNLIIQADKLLSKMKLITLLTQTQMQVQRIQKSVERCTLY